MFNMIEVATGTRAEGTEVPGWRVWVTRRVWKRCVALPKGAEGQTEGGRLHDLLACLGFNLRRLAAPRREQISTGFGFTVNVVNDHRRRSDHPDGFEWPGVEVPIAAFASFDENGQPLLVVLAESEADQLWMKHTEA